MEMGWHVSGGQTSHEFGEATPDLCRGSMDRLGLATKSVTLARVVELTRSQLLVTKTTVDVKVCAIISPPRFFEIYQMLILHS
jgi:hypothetical protein